MLEAEITCEQDADLNWIEILEEKTGIEIDPHRYVLTKEKLDSLIHAYGCSSVMELIEKGFSICSPPGLRQKIIHECTVHETRFFRSPGILKDMALEASKFGKEISIISVGCSTGEEVYSLAYLFAEVGITNARIKGLDVSQECIEKAKRGVYTGPMPKNMGVEISDKKWKVAERLRDMCEFDVCNISTTLCLEDKADFLICLNMLIYYREKTRHKMLGILSSVLNSDGKLYLNKGEDSGWAPLLFQKENSNEFTVFRKLNI